MTIPLHKRAKALMMNTALVGGSLLAALLFAEFLLTLPFWFPDLLPYLPKKLVQISRHYYLEAERNVVQLMPECAQYDSGLFYRLRPGRCDTREREFSVHYEINSKGLRDSEAALYAPEMISTGDSFAMGWGVSQESTYAKRVEKEWSHKVLNAGISSYGTAREILMIDQLDTSRLKYLIIQHCSNDPQENLTFVENDFVLAVSSPESYAQASQTQNARHYYPGRRVRYLVNQLRRPSSIQFESELSYERQATLFLQTISRFARRHPRVKVMVFETNSYALNTSNFVSEVRKQKNDSQYPKNVQEMLVEDFSPALQDKKYYYLLDDHLNELGHQFVAGRIAERLKGGW